MADEQNTNPEAPDQAPQTEPATAEISPAPDEREIAKDIRAKVADLNEAIITAATHDIVVQLEAPEDWQNHSKRLPLLADVLRRV